MMLWSAVDVVPFAALSADQSAGLAVVQQEGLSVLKRKTRQHFAHRAEWG